MANLFSIPSPLGAWGEKVDCKRTKVPICCTHDKQWTGLSQASGSCCRHLFLTREASCILCLVTCWSAELSYHKQSHWPGVGQEGPGDRYKRQAENSAVANKQSIIYSQPVKHFPDLVSSNQLISRAIIPQAITFARGCGKRGWGTGTSVYPARPPSQGTLSFAMI